MRERSNPGLDSSSILPVNQHLAAPSSSVLPSGTFESGDAINVHPGGVDTLARLLAGAPPGMNITLNYNCGTHTHTHTHGGNHTHGGTHHHNENGHADGGDELRQEIQQGFQNISQSMEQGFEEVNENLAFIRDLVQQVNEKVESTIRHSTRPSRHFNRTNGYSPCNMPAQPEPPAAASSEKESSEEGSHKWTHQGELEGATVFVNSEGLRKFVFAEGEGTAITEVANANGLTNANDDAGETLLEYEHAGSQFQAVPPRKEASWCKKYKEFCEKGKGEACHWRIVHGGGD